MWEKINELRKARGMTWRELSEKSGVAGTTIQETRKRDIRLSSAFRLADALGVSVEEFRKE